MSSKAKIERYDEFKFYLKSSLLGAFRGLIALPFEHPFDAIKTKAQSFDQPPPLREIIKRVYTKYGVFNGFYAGFLPNSIRVMIKQFYRYPMMLFFPNFFERLLPESQRYHHPGKVKIASGCVLACIETFIICPFERFKVFLMTRKRDVNLKEFFYQKNLLTTVFTGLESVFLKQLISWVSFLYFENYFKRLAKKYNNLPYDVELDSKSILITSSCVGVINVILVMPIDIIKTKFQMQRNTEYSSLSIKQAAVHIYEERGLKGFYVAWQMRLCQYVIQTFFTSRLYEHLEIKLRKMHE